jgi:tetraacyldisaccharide 4'-kinase
MPAGPLREPVADGLARADAVVLIGAGEASRGKLLGAAPADLPLLRAELQPAAGREAIAGRKVVAFAGIGRPEKFFASLRALGCRIIFAHHFPDHYPYSPDDIMRIVEAATAEAALPVTTAKDWVRLSPEARQMVQALDVELCFADEAALDRLLAPLDHE